jgi:pectin methylesterase-like acyl-CoA thioesterase
MSSLAAWAITATLTAQSVWAYAMHTKRGVSRTVPPQGCLVVRGNDTQIGEFSSIQSAIDSIASSTNASCIFVYEGTYAGQISIKPKGQLTIYGQTTEYVSCLVHSSQDKKLTKEKVLRTMRTTLFPSPGTKVPTTPGSSMAARRYTCLVRTLPCITLM